MLNSYLNQTASYKVVTGTDERGQPVYSSERIIPCRRCEKSVNVLEASSSINKVQLTYYLNHAVREGDMLDGRVITSVENMVLLGGKTMGYKAVML